MVRGRHCGDLWVWMRGGKLERCDEVEVLRKARMQGLAPIRASGILRDVSNTQDRSFVYHISSRFIATTLSLRLPAVLFENMKSFIRQGENVLRAKEYIVARCIPRYCACSDMGLLDFRPTEELSRACQSFTSAHSSMALSRGPQLLG
jgi:hypothetical protein